MAEEKKRKPLSEMTDEEKAAVERQVFDLDNRPESDAQLVEKMKESGHLEIIIG